MIRLEAFEKSDFDKLISWIDSEEMLMQFSGPAFTFPLNKEQLQTNLEDKKRGSYKVVDSATDAMVGYSEIYLLDRISVLLARIIIGDSEFRGKGLGQKIVKMLLEISFDQLGFENAELNVFDWNISAIRCYEKAGFVINPDKMYTREIKGLTWTAINMVIDKNSWERKNTN
jgi:RimJ/RimL family protein N-acetyltransferase